MRVRRKQRSTKLRFGDKDRKEKQEGTRKILMVLESVERFKEDDEMVDSTINNWYPRRKDTATGTRRLLTIVNGRTGLRYISTTFRFFLFLLIFLNVFRFGVWVEDRRGKLEWRYPGCFRSFYHFNGC